MARRGGHRARSSPISPAASAARCSFPSEAHLDPRRALPALAERLKRRGVAIRFGVDMQATATQADIVVDCRGLAARDVLPDLRGVRGEMVVIRSREVSLSRPVRLLHPRIPLYIVPRGDGVFMIGATTIESETRGGVSVRSAVELLNAAYALHPAFGEAEILELGADLRPAFPDNLPAVRRGPRSLQSTACIVMASCWRRRWRDRRPRWPCDGPGDDRCGSSSTAIGMTIEPATLALALNALGYGGKKIATAVNGRFVPAPARPQVELSDGDKIEVVAPMQGG